MILNQAVCDGLWEGEKVLVFLYVTVAVSGLLMRNIISALMRKKIIAPTWKAGI